MRNDLSRKGFTALSENNKWKLRKGSPYYIIREDGALIALVLGTEEEVTDGFRMVGAHTDSPCLQLKPKPDIHKQTLCQLGVEPYGGALVAPWFDRDLSLAGRVNCLSEDKRLRTLLIDFDKPLLSIPSVAIHLNREANENPQINKHRHLVPIFALESGNPQPRFQDLLRQRIKEQYPKQTISEILSFDIFCYDYQKPNYLGAADAFIVGGRLDNLVSCYIGAAAMQQLDMKKNCLLFCANHEENGSTSTSGAQGTFLRSLFDRIYPDAETKRIGLANSFFISMDNAHATHPNYADKSDENHNIFLNKGPVIKINANQRYATSSVSAAIYKTICKQAKVMPQEFVMRSDMPCGSTIGPLTAAQLGIRTVDVGIASFAMHSIREMTGRSDPLFLYRSIHSFMRSTIHREVVNV